MIGRADIEGSKSNVAMNAWLPQASYPCGRGQASICPFALREVSVPAELALGHLRYHLTDVPPQSNSPPRNAFGYLKRVIVTPAVYPRLDESLHFDIQSTGQKSHCVNIALRPSQCFVLIRQSDSPCPCQF
ncbi:hypothetical protein DAPPUDRAFT_119636 [Daphnia pulex]|uniref:Uncharacterized protein n=1 Tax=Daphnia pulex TaxID=6669 RepID=E9HZ40_DAPPU|nr:hypothetical protein DAPPUDRAFT_119636 [Daphnia pulex]|eukprot:EFX62987.1 hypothetical protein DAPPUDRAFT_119636 [Daphnia pulex]